MHFAVMVMTKPGGPSVDQLLAPYQDNSNGDCPPEYLEFVDRTAQVLREWEEGAGEAILFPDGRYFSHYDARFYLYDSDGRLFFCLPPGYVKVTVPHKQRFHSVDEFATKRYGYKIVDGRYGYYDNPNAHWDWYQIGGRWCGLLLVPDGAWGEIGLPSLLMDENELHERYQAPPGYRRVDSAKLEDIQWSKMRELRVPELERRWEEEDPYENPGMTKEAYIARYSPFFTYAVITPDGVWYDRNEEVDLDAWNAHFFDRFLREADPGTVITIVDCHS